MQIKGPKYVELYAVPSDLLPPLPAYYRISVIIIKYIPMAKVPLV